ncbi:MAG: radical SAM protein [Thermoplasmata archaeon]|nr:MAG: radical SAM protein [Thermoplasmata archaeon]
MIRAAIGTARILGLTNVKMDTPPTTAHFMTPGRCIFDCKFCTQARSSHADQKLLSRISWPEYDKEKVIDALRDKQDNFKRVCLQVVHSGENEDFISYVKDIRNSCRLPLSVDMKADDMSSINKLFSAGADVVGLPIDAANPKIYSEVKGGQLSSQIKLISEAAREFEGRISTHLMIGLGESEKDAVYILSEMNRMGVTTALFAFTPIKGTSLENTRQPSISSYRRIQVAKSLIENDLSPGIKYDDKGNIVDYGFGCEELQEKIKRSAFMTSGCLGCNRPYYNERPGGALYNYPYNPSKEEYKKALEEAMFGLEVQYG